MEGDEEDIMVISAWNSRKYIHGLSFEEIRRARDVKVHNVIRLEEMKNADHSLDISGPGRYKITSDGDAVNSNHLCLFGL